ncbi:MAG: hypothetical protein LBO72_04250 [Helicobacteraceae bacterium]|jgi:hypothetical protein|nr:hypothetical protein [Helicobacteraceae bacterium]
MTRLLFQLFFALFAANHLFADRIYSYESYWQTFSNRVFSDKNKYAMIEEEVGVVTEYSVGDYISYWNGVFQGKEYNISFYGDEKDILLINDYKIKPNSFIRLEGDIDSLRGISAHTIYFAKNYACVEGYFVNAQGKGVRHRLVYLIALDRPPNKVVYKLPSLFQSCLSIRHKNGAIYFDKVSYSYDEESDYPIGVIFEEHSINGDKFKQTGAKTEAYFLDEGDAYRFRLQKSH